MTEVAGNRRRLECLRRPKCGPRWASLSPVSGLVLEELGRRYDELEAVRGLSFSVPEGEADRNFRLGIFHER
jgi:hypothetical protein